jgi:hypothetical protein
MGLANGTNSIRSASSGDHAGAYSAAILAGCLGPFAVVRAPGGSLEEAFSPQQRRDIQDALRTMFGSPLPVVFLAREENGYRFEAPREIAEDVGLVMEDLSCREVKWRELGVAAPLTPATHEANRETNRAA